MIITPGGVSDWMVRHSTVSETGKSTLSRDSTKSTGCAPDTDCKWNTIFGMKNILTLLTSKHTVGELLTIGKVNCFSNSCNQPNKKVHPYAIHVR